MTSTKTQKLIDALLELADKIEAEAPFVEGELGWCTFEAAELVRAAARKIEKHD